MIQRYINTIILVDEIFLEDIRNDSIKDYDMFVTPQLDTKVLTLPLTSQSAIEDLLQVMDPSAIRTGQIVVRPGYTDQFIPVEYFSEDLIYRKYGLFVQLCISLGAKKVSVSSMEDVRLESSESRNLEAGMSAGVPFGTVEVEGKFTKSSLSDDFQKTIMNLDTEAQGGAPDFVTAEGMMQEYGLHKDPLFSGILNMCRNENNRLKHHQVALDFSQDVKRVFDSSMQSKIALMSKLYKGRVDLEMTRKSVERNRTATKLSVVVEF